MAAAVTWAGTAPDRCQLCSSLIGFEFFDKKTSRGPWAIMCSNCAHEQDGGQTGTGIGQKYNLMFDGTWQKVAG